METFPVLPRRMGKVVQGRGDKVNGYEIDVAAFETDQRQPAGQGISHLLQGLEEVVRPIDLVHRSGERVTDDHAGPIDPPGQTAGVAYQRFGLMFGAEVGMIQAAGLLEHLLGEESRIVPRDRDGADQVKAACTDLMSEIQRAPRSADVRTLEVGGLSRQIVQRAEVHEMLDFSSQSRRLYP